MDSKIELIFQKKNIGLGKRKESTARVFLIPGEGNIIINKISGNKYLQYNDTYLTTVWSPLEKLNLEKQFDIVAIVRGGLTGQVNSIRVARLLCKIDKENRLV
jgi:small subunit ribosomal protein S9